MKIKIVEVGPRDGLQNEKRPLEYSDKLLFIEKLIASGHEIIEVGSFVNEKKVPQMSSTNKLLKEVLTKYSKSNLRLPVLVPNMIGLNNALDCQVKEVSFLQAASNTFNKKNIGKTIDEQFTILKELVTAAKSEKLIVRGYLSTVFDCPYEGSISPFVVLDLVKKMFSLGINEISLGDTIGTAKPGAVKQLLQLLKKSVDLNKIALHFHDTQGFAIASTLQSLIEGVRIFDSSSGGLGGCPYAGEGASGNVATEDLCALLTSLGYSHSIHEKKILHASNFILKKIGRISSSKYVNLSLRDFDD